MKHLKSLGIQICVSFTLLVIGVITIETFHRGALSRDYSNILLGLLWTGIAVVVLSIYPLFEKLPTGVIILLQYVIALSCILISVRVLNFSESYIEFERYKDAFLSFTLFYGIGASVFYSMQRKSVKKNNEMLNEIKKFKQS